MIAIYFLKLDLELADPEIASLLPYLDLDRQQAVKRYVQRPDRVRALCSSLLTRSMIVIDLKISNQDIRFNYNQYHKPLLATNPDYHFNTAHSGEWVAAITASSPCGVDIEMVRPIDFDIAEKHFSESEYDHLLNQPESERLNLFYRLWTLKESYIKAIGAGLYLDLKSFSVNFEQDKPLLAGTQTHYFREYAVEPGYKAAGCSAETDFPDTVIRLTLPDIISNLSERR